MEEFLKQKPISFECTEDTEMNWYEKANAEEGESEMEPPSPKDERGGEESASSGIARVLDTLVDAASADQEWQPPSNDEVADMGRTLRSGVDKHSDDGGWASRKELRGKGHGKGSRPRGGGPRAKWMTKWHRLKKQGMTWADFVKANPEPPRSAASFS